MNASSTSTRRASSKRFSRKSRRPPPGSQQTFGRAERTCIDKGAPFRSVPAVNPKVRAVLCHAGPRVHVLVLPGELATYMVGNIRQQLVDENDPAKEHSSDPTWRRLRRRRRHKGRRNTKSIAMNQRAHRFHALLADLATVPKNRIYPQLERAEPLEMIRRPTPLRSEALELLGAKLNRTQYLTARDLLLPGNQIGETSIANSTVSEIIYKQECDTSLRGFRTGQRRQPDQHVR